MPLLNDHLSVWEISNRWAGFDKDVRRLSIPLAVKDHARILFEAILNSELDCLTLQMRKWGAADGEDMKPYFIRAHLEEIRNLIAGIKFDRKLMKWALIDRSELHEWCSRHEVPLPEFWFPKGWGLNYNWKAEEGDAVADEQEATSSLELRAPVRSRVAAQEMATTIWVEIPDMTIAAMIRHPDLVKYAKTSHYQADTVRRWLSEVAPESVRNKRGRPAKKPPSQT